MSAVPLDCPPAGQYVLINRTKRFQHFQDPRIYQLLSQICQLLGYYGDLSLLVDHFLDLYQQSSLHRKQAVLILSQILLGSTGTELPEVLGEDFKVFLIQSLYPVLEKLGDDSAIISEAAHATLASVCVSCGYSSVAQLIAENADYLVDAISLSLRHYSLNPRAPHVLRVMLQHSDKDILPLVQDAIEEILLALDQHYESRSVSFLRVLKSLVGAINRWFPVNKSEEQTQRPSRPSWDVEGPQSIRDFLVEYHRTKQVAHGLLDDDDITDVEHDGKERTEDAGNEEAMEEPDKKPEVPVHVKNVLEVLDRCRHLMSSGDPWLRLQVLDVTCEGLGLVALQDSQDHLLPQVHQLWKPFVHRMEDSEPLVILKAFETLCMMGKVCGDFIRKRVLKEAWPRSRPSSQTRPKSGAKSHS
ncbi:TEL2-interacting protein 1 [Branchiostoma belcheri]|nr:TEL2-interacting protein 1 [Branchiostoma belcheri]